MEQKPHIAVLPSPGMGHFIPMFEFAKTLALGHNFTVTLIIPHPTGPQSHQRNAFLESLSHSSLDYILLPQPSFGDCPEASLVPLELHSVLLAVTCSLPFIRDALKSLVATKNLVALVVDLFGTTAFDIAQEFNVFPYMFFSTNALSLALSLYLPTLDSTVSCEYRDLPQPIRIPGSNIQVYAKHLSLPYQDRQSILYKMHLEDVTKYRMAKGIIVNTFDRMEVEAIEFLKAKQLSNPPVYPVGPLVQTDFLHSITSSVVRANQDPTLIMKWQDEQPCNSVLYICFGSFGSLSPAQLHELAFGLEMNEIRFLWVVQIPNENNSSSTTSPDHHDNHYQLFSCLPHGFVERTKFRGLLVSGWAPQAQILSHESTGGFLTHCGWNSVLESVANGVPMMAWPLYAEQHMNAELLVEDLKIALRPRANTNSDNDQGGLEGRVEIANAVKNLMEGEEGQQLRRRTRDLKDAVAMAMREDGSSTKSMAELVCQWKSIKSSHLDYLSS